MSALKENCPRLKWLSHFFIYPAIHPQYPHPSWGFSWFRRFCSLSALISSLWPSLSFHLYRRELWVGWQVVPAALRHRGHTWVPRWLLIAPSTLMPHHGQEESMRQEEETQAPDVGSKPSLAPSTPSGNPVCCHFKASQESDHFPPAHNSHWDYKQDNLSPTLPWCLLPLALNLFFNTVARAFILQHKPKNVPSLLGNLQCLMRAYNELCDLCPNPWSPPCPFWPHLHCISHSLALLPPHWPPFYSTHQICPTSVPLHWLFPLPEELFTQRSA